MFDFFKHLNIGLLVDNFLHIIKVVVSDGAIGDEPVTEMTSSADAARIAPATISYKKGHLGKPSEGSWGKVLDFFLLFN